MLLWIYRIVFVPVLLLMAPYYLWRMLRRGGYGENFGHRLGRMGTLPPKPAGARRVWLQAVSVGEVLAIEPLLDWLLKEPGVEVYLTTTTSTGYRLARERYGARVLGLGYFPIDWWAFSHCAWRSIDPDLVILTEGERWPEHIAQARARAVPVVCINARMSERSFRRLSRIRSAVHLMADGITRLLPASEFDAARFRELGFPPDRIHTTGNLKVDVNIPRLEPAQLAGLRNELGLGAEDPIILGSSTWPGEEAALLASFRELRARGVRCRLLLVPRHAERRAEIAALLESAGLPAHFRSKGPAAVEAEVAVADTTGELRALTQLASVVFVGKSLPPHREGQTPVEAAALGKPILFGPELSNFHSIANELIETGAARRVDTGTLATELAKLLADPHASDAMASAARSWHARNQGALEKTLKFIRTEIRHGTK